MKAFPIKSIIFALLLYEFYRMNVVYINLSHKNRQKINENKNSRIFLLNSNFSVFPGLKCWKIYRETFLFADLNNKKTLLTTVLWWIKNHVNILCEHVGFCKIQGNVLSVLCFYHFFIFMLSKWNSVRNWWKVLNCKFFRILLF